MLIGRFEITRELGRGGMGIVYEARDTVIGRTVAIKTIRVDTATETEVLLDRLLREAKSAGVLAHPGIVIIHDIGRDGDVAYIAMERVDGPTVEALLRSSHSQSNEFILDILSQTAEALDHAHETGVVHRDIKPANIMLHKGKTVKITDFGIAKIQNTLHKSTGIMGTPVYMSPEHMSGKPVDGRSDQFALAVVAFQMLTGQLPFQGDDIGALVYQIIHAERPSATKVNPKLRSGVDPVLRRALAKEPEGRYRTCGEFVHALTTAMTETVPLQPLPRRGEDEKKTEEDKKAFRNDLRLRFILAAGLVLAAVNGMVGVFYGIITFAKWMIATGVIVGSVCFINASIFETECFQLRRPVPLLVKITRAVGWIFGIAAGVCALGFILWEIAKTPAAFIRV
jgi:serine/threonine protein kinase